MTRPLSVLGDSMTPVTRWRRLAAAGLVLGASVTSLSGCASDAGPAGLESFDAGALVSADDEVATTGQSLVSTNLVFVGMNSACALTSGGTVLCWGKDSVTGSFQSAPVQVAGLHMVMSLSLGDRDACAVEVGGAVKCWQLLRGTPAVRTGVTNAAAVDVSFGAMTSGHACALLTDGRVQCWGNNAQGQLGDGTTTNRTSPVFVSGLSDADRLSVGNQHTCARRRTGQLMCWGNSNAVGDGGGMNRTAPVAVPGMTNVLGFATGALHTCATQGLERAVHCWGFNSTGQVGDGTTYFRSTPRDTGLRNAWALSAGADFSCARVESASGVKCWGRNNKGQLGSASFGNTQLRPVDVPVPSPAASAQSGHLDSGGYSSCAATGSGTAFCWGSNEFGQLGDGRVELQTTVRPTWVLGNQFKALGTACTSGAGCDSGFCVDGVCCDTACGGGTANDCQACSTARGGTVTGLCGPTRASFACGTPEGCENQAVCNGTATTCPAETLKPFGTNCGTTPRGCALLCTGLSSACPPAIPTCY